MNSGDIVWIKSLNKEGMFMHYAIDQKDNVKCIIHLDEDLDYIVDEVDLEFIETLEESILYNFGCNKLVYKKVC